VPRPARRSTTVRAATPPQWQVRRGLDHDSSSAVASGIDQGENGRPLREDTGEELVVLETKGLYPGDETSRGTSTRSRPGRALRRGRGLRSTRRPPRSTRSRSAPVHEPEGRERARATFAPTRTTASTTSMTACRPAPSSASRKNPRPSIRTPHAIETAPATVSQVLCRPAGKQECSAQNTQSRPYPRSHERRERPRSATGSRCRSRS
jgi:hypothetical protein